MAKTTPGTFARCIQRRLRRRPSHQRRAPGRVRPGVSRRRAHRPPRRPSLHRTRRRGPRARPRRRTPRPRTHRLEHRRHQPAPHPTQPARGPMAPISLAPQVGPYGAADGKARRHEVGVVDMATPPAFPPAPLARTRVRGNQRAATGTSTGNGAHPLGGHHRLEVLSMAARPVRPPLPRRPDHSPERAGPSQPPPTGRHAHPTGGGGPSKQSQGGYRPVPFVFVRTFWGWCGDITA
jgi:hypothetical protein